jgi:hypothetical protein
MQDMRDFRDAKAMARTLRAALATKGLQITISESLELIAQAFGVADWNTLAAAIRAEGPAPRESAPRRPQPLKALRRPGFRPSSRRRCTAPSPTPTSETTSTQRWRISCSP